VGIENNELPGLTELIVCTGKVVGLSNRQHGQDGILTYFSVIFDVLPWRYYTTYARVNSVAMTIKLPTLLVDSPSSQSYKYH